MKKQKTLCSVALVLLVSGCFYGGTSGLEQNAVEPKLIGECSPAPCIRATISDVPPLPAEISPELRTLIETEVSHALYAPLDSDEPQLNSGQLMSELTQRYEEFTQPGFTDAPIDWEITRSATILYQNPEVLTIDVRSEGFVGGAHGFNDRQLLAYDLKKGKRLTLSEMIEPSSEKLFHQLVETQFRRAREVPAHETLSDAGYFVKPGEAMPVPENFGVTPGGLVVQYNPYEIAPYAFGPTEIVVPLEALQGVVRSDQKALVASVEVASPKA